jgi:isopenicillin N synthase-like dioxygenase
MLSTVFSVAGMLETGLSLPENSLTEKLRNGMHVLGPTGSDLSTYKKDTVFAGFHYDISFLTIHGKSKFPGLYVWLRTGEKRKVSIPDGCLLLQAGKEIEYLTGGFLEAGYHEVNKQIIY